MSQKLSRMNLTTPHDIETKLVKLGHLPPYEFFRFPMIRAAGTFNLESINRDKFTQECLRFVQKIGPNDFLKQQQLSGTLLECGPTYLDAE